METLKFKSNIKCMGCVEKVTPHLNEAVGTDQWSVDVTNPSKVLTVTSAVTEEQIKEAVQKAGFTAERL